VRVTRSRMQKLFVASLAKLVAGKTSTRPDLWSIFFNFYLCDICEYLFLSNLGIIK